MSGPKEKKELAKTRILAAASEVVVNKGALALTLEAVATRAGVSKGGLLYHFANKDALLEGLLEYQLDAFEQALSKSGLPFTEAYVQLGSYDGSQGLFSGLMATLALNPALLEGVRVRWQQWYRRSPSHSGPLVALLATDGLFLTQLLGIKALDADQKTGVLERLNRLAKEQL